jgi:predicted TIM-barrel fold metal-dependent hydrolase
MRVVALEEHFTIPSAAAKISAEAKAKRGFVERVVAPGAKNPLEGLPDIGQQRLDLMDKSGITVQVLSISGPGAELMEGQVGIDIAKEVNDGLAKAIQKHPKRFAGFAHLPLSSPEACAKELERCVKDLGFVGAIVNGTINGKFLDDARFASVLSMAEQLDVPVYLHPHLPPASVKEAYYSGLPGSAQIAISTAGWGWHSETAIHVLRLAYSGALDRHRKLKLIVGHMGEGLPMMLARIDDVSRPHVGHLQRPVSEMLLSQLWLTTSGMFTQPPLLACIQVFGLDRVMFSVDYPYSGNEQGRKFLDECSLPPVDMAKFCHGTADALLKLKA